LPLYRQEKIFNRHGVELTRQKLANWVIKCSQALDPLLDIQRQLSCPVQRQLSWPVDAV
jgi:transposase